MSKEISTEFTLKDSFIYVTSSALFFVLFNQLCKVVLKKFEFLRTHSNFWRFKNTFISWIHAIIASVLVAINIYKSPNLFEDMINASTRYSYIEICISMGYFVYDAVDIIYSNKKLSSQSKEVLLHHGLIVFIFSVPLSVNKFVGYTIGALSIEFNTVLLHLRFLLVFCNADKNSIKFKTISILNLITFIMFRIITLCWMTRWIVLNRHLLHVVWFSIGSIGLAIMMVINIFLLQRLLQSDFSRASVSNKPIVVGDSSNKKEITNLHSD